MSHEQSLADPAAPPLHRRLGPYLAVAAARMLLRLPPRRLRTALTVLRRGAPPADYDRALRARQTVIAVSTRCSGQYCLQRSVATALLCRLHGSWPTWKTGVRTSPTAAHAWVEAEGRPVGEPHDTAAYRAILTVTPAPR
ncbi:lasso peptide biosynthesis B2 protein [Nocardia mexicana]|uniref:Transglutaminase superfamily protein n=1 Tax=Nocardia mexicana TaxID=279262 RepID=A0A370H821_9NOCA|nr:lasso peptide biosynthesis B2 protein [Nocardia mexicana]RDI52822.1 transglutaminase superfamily protein [Nocardia mexicana]